MHLIRYALAVPFIVIALIGLCAHAVVDMLIPTPAQPTRRH